MDLMSDRLANGRPFRMLTVVDQYTRACPLLLVDTFIGGCKVAAALTKAAEGIGLAQTMTVNNCPEFATKCSVSGLTIKGSSWILSGQSNP